MYPCVDQTLNSDCMKDLHVGALETSTFRDPEHDNFTLSPGSSFKRVPSSAVRAGTEVLEGV